MRRSSLGTSRRVRIRPRVKFCHRPVMMRYVYDKVVWVAYLWERYCLRHQRTQSLYQSEIRKKRFGNNNFCKKISFLASLSPQSNVYSATRKDLL